MSLRDVISGAEQSEDEVVAAIRRQIKVLRSTIESLVVQVESLEAEAKLLDRKPERPIMSCGHADAVTVDTVDGVVKVCPDCD